MRSLDVVVCVCKLTMLYRYRSHVCWSFWLSHPLMSGSKALPLIMWVGLGSLTILGLAWILFTPTTFLHLLSPDGAALTTDSILLAGLDGQWKEYEGVRVEQRSEDVHIRRKECISLYLLACIPLTYAWCWGLQIQFLLLSNGERRGWWHGNEIDLLASRSPGGRCAGSTYSLQPPAKTDFFLLYQCPLNAGYINNAH